MRRSAVRSRSAPPPLCLSFRVDFNRAWTVRLLTADPERTRRATSASSHAAYCALSVRVRPWQTLCIWRSRGLSVCGSVALVLTLLWTLPARAAQTPTVSDGELHGLAGP